MVQGESTEKSSPAIALERGGTVKWIQRVLEKGQLFPQQGLLCLQGLQEVSDTGEGDDDTGCGVVCLGRGRGKQAGMKQGDKVECWY